MPFPNEETQFKPGQSGNPNGRPPGARSLKTVLKKLLSEELSIKKKDASGNVEEIVKMDTLEAMTLAQVKKAIKGDTNAFRELMDRYEGRPTQAVSLFGDEPVTGIQVSILTDKGQFEEWKKKKEQEDKLREEMQ